MLLTLVCCKLAAGDEAPSAGCLHRRGRRRCSGSGRPGAVVGVTSCGDLSAEGADDLGPTAQVGRSSHLCNDPIYPTLTELLKQIDKDCTEQFRELNRKLGSMSKRVGKLEKKVEAFGSTPATVVNSTHDEVSKYLKPATMEKFQDLEDMLKHSQFYNELRPYCNLILILVKTKSRSLHKHDWTKRRTGPP
ncbi:hypothetical protein QAD02_003339 [Eretmocerus hayati]|uniref:Uncharacterized protein n=1 Tax=Eretmocerus hayati TaxID=131215 RepID=A0ACC2NLK2_9HYME|nr:hypothetical protein QAD02_003339 [Eretmocerus hayati]